MPLRVGMQLCSSVGHHDVLARLPHGNLVLIQACCHPYVNLDGSFNPRLLQEFQASFMAAKQAHAPWLHTPGEPFSRMEARQAASDARYAQVHCCSCGAMLVSTAMLRYTPCLEPGSWAVPAAPLCLP